MSGRSRSDAGAAAAPVNGARRGSVRAAMRRLPLVSIVGLGLALSSTASAQVALPLTEVEGDAIRVDGSLREWSSARFMDVGSGDDASMRIALAYDATGIYVGAEVRDDRLVRTARPGPDEDAIVLTFAMPRGRDLVGTEVWIWAGESGRSAASVGVGGVGARRLGSVAGARVVEGPRARGSGYVVEAYVPWRGIAGGDRFQQGRGTVRLRDVDQAAHPVIEAEPTIAAVDPAHLERLPNLAPSGGESALLDSFLASRGLEGTRPTHDLRGDVGGADARPERVVIVDRFVHCAGPGWAGGRSYGFVQLAVGAPADLREARLVDLTGDGKDELVVVLRQRSGEGSRDLWQVLGFEGERIAPIFGIEIRKETSAGHVESTLTIGRPRRRGEALTIEVRSGAAHGLDATSLRETPAADVEGMLYPWGPVAARTYRWDGRAFARVSEEPNASYVDPAAASGAASPTPPREPTPPPAPGVEDVLAEYRRQHQIAAAAARPRFRVQANVAGNDALEEIVVYGRDLVVVGPAFRGGTGWFDYELPGHSPDDVLDVRAAELTGDARSEIVVRLRQVIGDVRREVIAVYQFTPSGFPTLLVREVAREAGGNRIENEVRLVGGALEVRPGGARGWSRETWPYGDAPSTDGVLPLLLPWRDAAVRHRYSGGRLVAP